MLFASQYEMALHCQVSSPLGSVDTCQQPQFNAAGENAPLRNAIDNNTPKNPKYIQCFCSRITGCIYIEIVGKLNFLEVVKSVTFTIFGLPSCGLINITSMQCNDENSNKCVK